jgi:hypothetical protein
MILPCLSKTAAVSTTRAGGLPPSRRIFSRTSGPSFPPRRFRPEPTASAPASCTNCAKTASIFENRNRRPSRQGPHMLCRCAADGRLRHRPSRRVDHRRPGGQPSPQRAASSYNYPIAATRLDPTTRPERATLVVRRIQIVHHKPRRPSAHQPRRSVLVFPAKAGIHARHGHRTEPVLGPANGRDPWAGVTGYLRLFGMRLQSAG